MFVWIALCFHPARNEEAVVVSIAGLKPDKIPPCFSAPFDALPVGTWFQMEWEGKAKNLLSLLKQ